jgi:hypothetical protein
MRRLLVITQSNFDPSSRLRLMQYFPGFAKAGWRIDHRPLRPSPYRTFPVPAEETQAWKLRVSAMLRRASLFADSLRSRSCDAVIVGRELPHLSGFLTRCNPRLAFDFDDAIHLWPGQDAVARLARKARVIVAGNQILAGAAAQWCSAVRTIPTVVDPEAYRMARCAGSVRRLRVGWLGSDYSIRQTLFPFVPMLAALQREVGFEFVVVSGPGRFLPGSELDYRFVPWSPAIESQIADMFDIGIMPLQDDPLQRAKCGTKLLQYMAAGLPVVASPVGVNGDIVKSGHNGYLAYSPEDWRSALQQLAADKSLRSRLGEAGRALVEQEYSLGRWLPAWLEVLEETARTG